MIWKAHGGNVAAASVYHAVACRIVFALGGHTRVPLLPKDRELNIQERHDHHLRSIFWLCYIFDKEAALRTTQPPIIGDEYCDLTLPEGYFEHIYGARRNTYELHEIPMPWLISDLRLVQIQSRVAKELYSVASSKMSDAELLLTIRELDEELECWRLSIPTDFAPSLAIRKGAKLNEHLGHSGNMLQIELHLAYHRLLSIIHCASGRCAGDPSNATSATNFGLQSSLDLSVEASRSTLIFLSIAVHRLLGEAFWLAYTLQDYWHFTYLSVMLQDIQLLPRVGIRRPVFQPAAQPKQRVRRAGLGAHQDGVRGHQKDAEERFYTQ